MDQMSPPESRMQALVYDGRLGELYALFLKNILLTILTLGIWRFWAVTRYRRYFWSRMQFQGERFEYTGRGGELFGGFLLALLVLIGGTIIAGVVSYVAAAIAQPLAFIPMAIWYVFILVLAAGAVFSAQRYRLTRTLWCGIRGGMTGSMLAYGVRSILYTILAGLTLFQLLPWSQIRLAERRINASNFGTAQFSFRGRAAEVYLPFLLTLIATVVLFAAIAGGVFAIVQSVLSDGGIDADEVLQSVASPAVSYTILGGFLLFGILSTLVSCWYQAVFERHVVGNSALGGVRFASSMTGRGLFGLVAGNLLIALFTLGLGYPIILHRNATFLSQTLWMESVLDPVLLGQSRNAAPRLGEGMYQVLDGSGGIF